MTDFLEAEIRKEACYFCKVLLGKEASVEFIEAYFKAHEKVPQNLLKDQANIRKIVENRLDPDAIEFASRPKLQSLKLKLLLVCYLAENLPGYEDLFLSKNQGWFKGLCELLITGFKLPFVFFKGSLQRVRNGII